MSDGKPNSNSTGSSPNPTSLETDDPGDNVSPRPAPQDTRSPRSPPPMQEVLHDASPPEDGDVGI